MIILFFAGILIGGIVFLLRRAVEYSGLSLPLSEENGFSFLLIWIIFGFLTRLDYSTAAGCMSEFEPIFEPLNILFSTISLGLILVAYKLRKPKLKAIVCLIELIYWIVKLMIYKGGYAVGLAGMPDLTIVIYDLIAVMVRLFILGHILGMKKWKYVKIGLIALLIIGLRVNLFILINIL